MFQRDDPVTKAEVLAPHEWIEKLTLSGLLNLLCIPHFGRSLELNAVVKVLLSYVHNDYLWLDHKVDLNVDVIHHITGLSKVSTNPSTHFVGKILYRKLPTKLTNKFNLSKGGRSYDAMNI
jgi:hypothetical protein